MMKKLIALGTVLGAAAYLRNKDRRDHLMARSRGVIDDLKLKAQSARERVEQRKASKTAASDEALFNDTELAGQTTSPGYRSPPPPRGNGIY